MIRSKNNLWRPSAEKQRQEKLHENRLDLLTAHGVHFRTESEGHIIIDDPHKGRVDYWPNKGIFKSESLGASLQGDIVMLLQFLSKPHASSPDE